MLSDVLPLTTCDLPAPDWGRLGEQLPVEWIMDDAPLFNPQGNAYANPRDVAQVWMDEFDRAWDEGSMFLLTMHPHISGHRSRVVALEMLLAHMKQKGNVWFATHREVAEYVRKQAGMGTK